MGAFSETFSVSLAQHGANLNLLPPSNLALSLISTGVKVDWTDTNSAIAQTEVWGKSDSDVYALLYTIDAGTVSKNDAVNAVDLRYYKIRAKKGSIYSDFTAEASIAMLGTELVVNGNFAAWTGNDPNGWGISKVGTATITQDAGRCKFETTDSGSCTIYQFILTNGLNYRILVQVDQISDPVTLSKVVVGVTEYTLLGTGLNTLYKTANGVNFMLKRYGFPAVQIFDNVSVKRVLFFVFALLSNTVLNSNTILQ